MTTATTRTNPICAKCKDAHTALNGRYCHLLKCYVEYDRQPRCQAKK